MSHAGFIIATYGITFGVIIGLVVYTIKQGRNLSNGCRQGQTVDLTPRTSPDNAPLAPRKHNRKWKYVAMLVVVVSAGGFIVSQFLTSAIDFYCNVDEIGKREGCEPNRRLRVQGTVEQDSLRSDSGSTTFVLLFNNQTVNVRYNGDPGGIFQECIPVVAHGQLVGDTFEANRIEVKHSNSYSEANPDRLAQSKAEQCSLLAG